MLSLPYCCRVEPALISSLTLLLVLALPSAFSATIFSPSATSARSSTDENHHLSKRSHGHDPWSLCGPNVDNENCFHRYLEVYNELYRKANRFSSQGSRNIGKRGVPSFSWLNYQVDNAGDAGDDDAGIYEAERATDPRYGREEILLALSRELERESRQLTHDTAWSGRQPEAGLDVRRAPRLQRLRSSLHRVLDRS